VLLEIGTIVKPHGIRGEVVVELVSNRPEERLAPGSVLSGDAGELRVRRARPHQRRWIVELEGVDDRTAAEALRGTVLRAEALREDGTLWAHELVGVPVVDREGRSLGVVQALEANPASDLLVLAGDRLVPLTFVVSYQAGGSIVVDPPEGLLD
jgi:16S rRNA processing protein RimM